MNTEKDSAKISFKKNGISADALKWIAVVTMFIDHIGAVIIEKTDMILLPYGRTLDLVLRYIGRLAFPIFAFLLVEGFYHTRDRQKYLRNLFIFAILSEIPFELAFLGEIRIGFLNVFWTLTAGMFMMILLEREKERRGQKTGMRTFFIVAGTAIAAQFFHTDYGAIGVLLIYILYILRVDRKQQCILGAVAMSYEITAPIAFLFLYRYNGSRRQKHLKYFFYAFYPLHLLLLYWLRILI